MTDGKISLTFKGMHHPQQPWLVVSADTALELGQLVASLGIDITQYLQAVGSTGTISGASEQALANIDAGGLNAAVAPDKQATPQAYTPPAQAAPQPPAQNTNAPWGAAPSNGNFSKPQCHHGVRQHREGNGKRGPWAAWMCPSPQGTPDQCKPIWSDSPEYVAP